MAQKYLLDCGLWNSVFAVPTQIVDNYMKLCGAAQLKVLLVLLRNGGAPLSAKELSDTLNLSTGDIQDALNYWVDCGLLRQTQEEEQTALRPASPSFPAPSPALTPSQETPPDKPRLLPSSTPPKPKPAEFERLIRENGDLRCLLQEAESSWGKALSSSDIATLISLHQWAGMRIEVILAVMDYCKNAGKMNLRYVEKTALSWAEKGIETFEQADRYIQQLTEQNSRCQLIKSVFGIYDRNLTSKETEYIRVWFEQYHFEIPLMKLAYERCVERTGKLSFPYIHKILSNWEKKGITTPEQAAKEEEQYLQSKTSAESKAPSYDIDEFERYLASTTPK